MMASPLSIPSRFAGGPIRSVTIGNQTTSTVVIVYPSLQQIGTPLYAIIPGQFATLPIMDSSGITFAFAAQAGSGFDGSIFIHVDPQALAASGFASPTQAPIWVWDSSTWDGGAVWGK
jgi:hypothetical protein